MKNLSRLILLTPLYLVITFFAFISIASLSEWWNIKINKEIDKYAWGPTNENSWFYENSDLYANVQLTEGIFMMLLVSLTIKSVLKKSNKLKYWLFSCFIFFLIMIINGSIH